jgi:hypothetical protein
MLGICIEYSWHLKLHIWSAYGFTILGDVSACSILDITLDQGCVNKKKERIFRECHPTHRKQGPFLSQRQSKYEAIHYSEKLFVHTNLL